MTQPIPFPQQNPEGYATVNETIRYDAAEHLAFEFPEQIWTLADFGYSQKQIDRCASPVAVTSPFRLLSEAGVEALHEIATTMMAFCSRIDGSRVPRHLAGGVYRSRFLRDLCNCPVILEHMSRIARTELLAHSMPSQQLYINYPPEDITRAVDAWHFDGIGFDYVLMASDPRQMKGGNFEYFKGTRDEVAAMFDLDVDQLRYGISDELPADRVIKADFPAAGYAIFQQGNMIVHRAAKLLEAADRITLVPGMIAADFNYSDPTAKHDMPGYGEPGINVELARHSAWLAQARLKQLIETLPMSSSDQLVETALANAISDVVESIQHIKTDT
ncbi:MAG: hypothetical protein ACI9LO_002497 [Planctomycetota bacterium]